MTSVGNSFNDFPKNQLTKFQLGGKNITILHTFAAPFQYNLCTAENGSFGVPGRPRWGRGTMRPKHGTVGNPRQKTHGRPHRDKDIVIFEKVSSHQFLQLQSSGYCTRGHSMKLQVQRSRLDTWNCSFLVSVFFNI